jgi:predicted nucleic acid-binding protein
MPNYVLDTNMISYILRGDATAISQMRRAVVEGGHMVGCPLVWYEIRRGLLKRGATRQLRQFEQLFGTFDWQDFNCADWEIAADLWVARHIRGLPMADADLLIGAFAKARSAILVTANASDFTALGVTLEDLTHTL